MAFPDASVYDKAQRIGGKAGSPARLTDSSVARIIKSRVKAHLMAKGESEAFASAQAQGSAATAYGLASARQRR